MLNPFSIFKAATDCPNDIGIRCAGQDFSFSKLALLTQNHISRLENSGALPPKGRPYVVEGKNTVETVVELYALMEAWDPRSYVAPEAHANGKTGLA